MIKVVRSYSSFFNYEVLEHMIEQDGSGEDKENLLRYKENFLEYSRRRIYECPSKTGCKSDKELSMDMIMKLDSKYDEYTSVSDIQDLRVRLGELLQVNTTTLHLHRIDEG